MKIMQLDVHYGGSSTGKLVAELTQRLRSKGHQVLALHGRGPRANDAGVFKIAAFWEVLLHVLATRLTGWTGIYSFFATRKFLRHLDAFKPDVVHLHELHGYYLNIYTVMAALRQRRIATVWTFHCEFMYTGNCGYTYDCDKWKTECHACPRLREYPQTWGPDFTRAMFRHKREAFAQFHRLSITAPSEWLSRRIRQSMVADKPISTVPNGIDVGVFSPKNTQCLKAALNLQEQFVVLCVGADVLSERKGGRWALALAKQWQDQNMVLVMVGVEQMPAQVVPPNVRMVAPVRDAIELATYYSLANVLLLTSEKETFSMVCAESLACGTPVIGFDSGAPKEVAPSGYGAFVPYADLDALTKLLTEFRDDRSMLKSAEECVAFARDRYAIDSMVERFETIYTHTFEQGKILAQDSTP
ncbi:MAG: hypothetical protein RJB34_1380 [Pseudomonadota bacterium]|jgi:glycosyltransferase involved in cell wall biosynthesis